MKISVLCYALALAFIFVDGSICIGTLRTAYSTKSKVGYFIGFGSMFVTLIIVAALVTIGVKLG